MPDSNNLSSKLQVSSPDYNKLVKFLVSPFLESSESVKVDSELSPRTSRVLIRLAIEGEDKGRVFGRGGRNIQAIRTVLQSVAQAAGHTAHLDIFGSQTGRDNAEDKPPPPTRNSRRPPRPRPH